MTYWKIKYMEEHLAIEKENATGEETITQDYIYYLEKQLKLVKQAYEQGLEDAKSGGGESG